MKRLLLVFLILSVTLLAACGGDDEATPAASDADTSESSEPAGSTEDAGFTATVTGAVETTISKRGFFQCDPVNGSSEYTIAGSFSMSDNVLILMSSDIGTGSHEFAGDDFNAVGPTVSFVGESLQTHMFEDEISGTLQLDALPTKVGEQVAGSFEFTATNLHNAEETVTVEGSFDFLAGDNAFFNCEQ